MSERINWGKIFITIIVAFALITAVCMYAANSVIAEADAELLEMRKTCQSKYSSEELIRKCVGDALRIKHSQPAH